MRTWLENSSRVGDFWRVSEQFEYVIILECSIVNTNRIFPHKNYIQEYKKHNKYLAKLYMEQGKKNKTGKKTNGNEFVFNRELTSTLCDLLQNENFIG